MTQEVRNCSVTWLGSGGAELVITLLPRMYPMSLPFLLLESLPALAYPMSLWGETGHTMIGRYQRSPRKQSEE